MSKQYKEKLCISKISVERMNELSRGYSHFIHAIRAYMWVNYPAWDLEKEVKYKVVDIEIISEKGDDIVIGLLWPD